MTAQTIAVPLFDLVVLGGGGDLARRKLLPALYHRDAAGQIPEAARIIMAGRQPCSLASYRRQVTQDLKASLSEALDQEVCRRFLGRLSYLALDVTQPAGWDQLKRLIDQQPERVRAYYLALAPNHIAAACAALAAQGLHAPPARLVVEKPLGFDLASARQLEKSFRPLFDERRIYRIDHYLGKETVQNLMALRFANALFEPLWNARFIDHIQITVAEDLGVAARAATYEATGALRDMVQNHLFQLLCLTAMEPPSAFCADSVRDEKRKVLEAVQPIAHNQIADHMVLGQYGGRALVPSYRADVGIGESQTETFAALKLHIANWRWQGVPFYLRTGKRLRRRLSEIAIVFRRVPHNIFAAGAGNMESNALILRLQPDEGVDLSLMIKDPGPGGLRLTSALLDMSFADRLAAQGLRMPDAYERLLMDVVRGDQTLFMRADEIEVSWRWIDAARAAHTKAQAAIYPYDAGGTGPDEALSLIHKDGRKWRKLGD